MFWGTQSQEEVAEQKGCRQNWNTVMIVVYLASGVRWCVFVWWFSVVFKRQNSSSSSVNVEDVGLFQAKACLVFVEECGERVDVHGVVHFHHVWSRVLHLGHCDGFSNCRRETLETVSKHLVNICLRAQVASGHRTQDQFINWTLPEISWTFALFQVSKNKLKRC